MPPCSSRLRKPLRPVPVPLILALARGRRYAACVLMAMPLQQQQLQPQLQRRGGRAASGLRSGSGSRLDASGLPEASVRQWQAGCGRPRAAGTHPGVGGWVGGLAAAATASGSWRALLLRVVAVPAMPLRRAGTPHTRLRVQLLGMVRSPLRHLPVATPTTQPSVRPLPIPAPAHKPRPNDAHAYPVLRARLCACVVVQHWLLAKQSISRQGSGGAVSDVRQVRAAGGRRQRRCPEPRTANT